jgi:SAM-dependent methyltransferase
MPSFDRPADPTIAPSDWMVRFAPLIVAGGTVLDLACGHGRHARWFSQRGFQVIAADIDTSGLPGDLADVSIVQRDLEDNAWPWASGSFDAIIVANYLHRPHFPHLVTSLRAGGVLLLETFAAGNERFGRPRNPAFLLQPGELLAAFSDSLQIVAYEHGIEVLPRPAVRQRLCAIRQTGPVHLPEPR